MKESSITKIEISDNDVVVIKVDDSIPSGKMEELLCQFKDMLGTDRVVLIQSSTNITILSKKT